MGEVQLYDTTLRDGSQSEGISFSSADKLKIVAKLDELGIHYIEGGWPGSNPKDMEFYERVRNLRLLNSVVAAFTSTRRAKLPVDEDASIAAVLVAAPQMATVVGKSWDLHVTEVLRTSLDENLRMIEDTVRYLRAKGLRVIYDAEHFFDGYLANPDYALRTLEVAGAAGVETVVLCDTNGGVATSTLAGIMDEVHAKIDMPLGIHAHNDSELAVANSLAAVEHGATQVQGTINGYGERCGNANLCSIIPALKLKMGIDVISDDQLSRITDISHFVSETANMRADPRLPYVGRSAFAHKGGIHAAAMARWGESYQHIDPALVGNEMRVVVSELSGRSNVLQKAREMGIDLTPQSERARNILQHIKELENQGFQFEAADGSLELLIRRAQPDYVPPFELMDFFVLVETRSGGDVISEATIKVRVGDRVMHTAADGNGPVNALDSAIRKALLPLYPQLEDIHLRDYKVRILDETAGTRAQTRVLIYAEGLDRSWTTVGSGTNIIEASWLALSDSLEYGLIHAEGKQGDES